MNVAPAPEATAASLAVQARVHGVGERQGTGRRVVEVRRQADRRIRMGARRVADHDDVPGEGREALEGTAQRGVPLVTDLRDRNRHAVDHRLVPARVRHDDQVRPLGGDPLQGGFTPAAALVVGALDDVGPDVDVGGGAGGLRHGDEAPATLRREALERREPLGCVGVPEQHDGGVAPGLAEDALPRGDAGDIQVAVVRVDDRQVVASPWRATGRGPPAPGPRRVAAASRPASAWRRAAANRSGRADGEAAEVGVGSAERATLVISPPTAGPPDDTVPAANPSEAVTATTVTDSTPARASDRRVLRPMKRPWRIGSSTHRWVAVAATIASPTSASRTGHRSASPTAASGSTRIGQCQR